MRIVLVGSGPEAGPRAEALRGMQYARTGRAELIELDSGADADRLVASLPAGAGVVFMAPGMQDHAMLAEIARRGIHLFLERPAASSVPECLALAELSEEAGVEIGVSRPLRFYSWKNGDEPLGHVDVVTIRQTLDVRVRGGWKRALEDAVDLAQLFARGASPRRIDAAAARNEHRLPLSTAAGIRFQNGTYAQLDVRHGAEERPQLLVWLAGSGRASEFDLTDARTEGYRRETAAFLDAVGANRPPPVSVLDALQTIRLMEKLMERLRG